TGVSNIDLTTTPVTIYGGMAGECTATSNTSTCDSCTLDAMALDVACAFAAEGLCACNKARIHDGLIFRINVTKPSTVTGNAKLIVGANSTIVTPNIEDNNGNYFQATWGNLCSAFGSASCAAVTTVINGRLFIDAD